MLGSQEHRHLSCHHELTLTALAVNGCRSDIEMMTYFIYNIIHCERMVVNLHSPLDDTLCQSDIDIAVIYDTVSQKSIDSSLQVTHTSITSL